MRTSLGVVAGRRMMDELAALRLQIEWGADEALLDGPVDRLDRGAAGRPAGLAGPAVGRVLAPVGAPALLPAREVGDLAGLQAALAALDHPLRSTATTTVAPSGNPAAGLVLIAEAPGREDDRSGQAFSGPPGEALDAVLRSAGLSREGLLLTFLVPWRPPGGRDPSPAEIGACLPYVHRLLALTEPRRLVLLGQAPLRALGGSLNLRQARGRWIDVEAGGAMRPALPMLAAEQWRKSAANRQNTWADLLTLQTALEIAPRTY